jgi:YD repeat-containing protein
MYAYNNADEMTSYAEGQASGSTCGTPPAASAILLTYDARGRLLTTNYPSTTPDITRTYDANGNLLTINRGGANWTYAYNSVDLPGSETLVIDARTYAITNTYDNNERLTQRKFPSGNTYAYTNDGLGRPTALKQGTTTYASAIGWHPNGMLSALTRGNGDVFTQQLNARQLTAFIGSNIGDDLNYTYDANGRVTVINAVANNA